MRIAVLQAENADTRELAELLTRAGFQFHPLIRTEELDSQDLPEDTRLICIDSSLGEAEQNALCVRIRQHARLKMLPVVVLTDVAPYSDDMSVNALRSGATEILSRLDTGLLERSFGEFAQRFRSERLFGKVLVVEDDQLLAKVISTHLTSTGLEVAHCCSAEEALQRFEHNSYDLVITDFLLAGNMTGLALLRALRSNPKSETRLPVLVMSAFDDPARKLEILHSGADDYLAKPIEPLELITRVGNFLRTKFMCDSIRQQKEELEIISTTDALTGLRNKRYLDESAAAMLSTAHRHGEALSLIVIDLDRFKPVNDTHGHETGDRVLARIGKALNSMTRSGDVAARFGGDEFVVLMSHTDLDAAQHKAESICAAIRELQPRRLNVTASLGVAQLSSMDGADFSALFRKADQAVYQAKKRGGNCVCTAADENGPRSEPYRYSA